MKQRTINRVNGGIAIYYGIGCAIVAAMSVITLGVWVFQVLTQKADFSWGFLGGLVFMTLLTGGLAFAILRVGYEEIER